MLTPHAKDPNRKAQQEVKKKNPELFGPGNNANKAKDADAKNKR